jgi:23S rRNA (guanosine2251-2'-O)-methyltransferase
MAPKSSLKTQITAILLLHDIRSVYNVGALFRTADAIGITEIILSGFSPSPIDRFGRPRHDLAKSALGSEKKVPWKYVKSPVSIIKKMKTEGFHVICIEQDVNSVDYKKVTAQSKNLFILGTETTGISKSLLNLCDTIAEIPMKGMKESLNVSVAAGIVLYRILDK